MAFAFAFRREVFASLDVSYTAATSLPPSRRCRLNGALFDERLLVTWLAPLLETNLRAEPCETLNAADGSPSGAGGCSASITPKTTWPRKKGGMFVLIWKREEPPSNMHDVRAVAAPLALKLKWTTLFSHRFLAGKHINLLELESLICLLRRIARAGIRAKRLLVLVDSRVVLGAVSKGHSCSRAINFLLRKLGFWCLACDIALELVWVPTWANPADAPSRNKPIANWYASVPKLPSTPTAVLASAPALSELNLLCEPLSIAAQSAREHVRKLDSSGAFSCSELKPAYVDNEISQMTCADESNSMPSEVCQLCRERAKNDWRDAKTDGSADYPPHV